MPENDLTEGLLDKSKLKSKANTSAKKQEVKSNELASEQLADITGEDSALRQRAEKYGAEYATSRGMLNSSMAASKSFGELVDRSSQIASENARRYGQVADRNQAAVNQSRLEDKRYGQRGLLQRDQTALDEAQAENQRQWRSEENTLDRSFQHDVEEEQRSFQRRQQNRQQEDRAELAAQEAQNRLDELGYQNALKTQQIDQQSANEMIIRTESQIQKVLSDPELTPESKENQVQNIIESRNNSLDAIRKSRSTEAGDTGQPGGGTSSDAGYAGSSASDFDYGASTPGVPDTGNNPNATADRNALQTEMVEVAEQDFGYVPNNAEVEKATEKALEEGWTLTQARQHVKDVLTEHTGKNPYS